MAVMHRLAWQVCPACEQFAQCAAVSTLRRLLSRDMKSVPNKKADTSQHSSITSGSRCHSRIDSRRTQSGCGPDFGYAAGVSGKSVASLKI